ncbi:hypothetical protein SEUCBS139899_005027 [Sporothrix eucalyptigena]|uniref:Involucrin repeat protein n=1 Tax=Sporothrix eucalyptigena TaxID=1812306 RepID=A0ABP0AX63_9PEZI
MNGLRAKPAFGVGAGGPSPFQDVVPTGRAMADGYRQEIINGFEAERPRYNPMNADRPQSSPLVDLKDPIQVHLLTETALSDSREWVILSQEEVDDLKKQCQSLTQRIEQTQANLAIQSKYRDAAISMAKLYSPGKRKSGMSNRSSSDADAERIACERRCEELASELFTLEKRLMEPQRRLFQHTAGILQLTHRAASRNKAANGPAMNGLPINGIPGSPESMYTYSNGRESMELVSGDGMFDDRSLYLPIDQPFDASGRPKKNPLEIPQKSPIRKETMELREESDRLRDVNTRLQQEVDELRASSDSLGLELAAIQRESGERLQSMSDAERQIEDLNGRLREIIVRFNPKKNGGYEGPPASGNGSNEPNEGLSVQIQYLTEGLGVAQQEQEINASETARQADLGAALTQFESRMSAVNDQLQRILSASASALPPIPSVSGVGSSMGLNNQLSWLEDVLPTVETEVGRAADIANASATNQQAAQQVDTILMGLWDIIQSGFADLQRKREERKASRAQMGLADDEEEDVSGDESPINPNETYSLQAFSAKVQWLYSQTTKLREHKSVLKRQIKQQRELNNKSDAEKDQELQNKIAELQTSAAALQNKTVELQQSQQAAEDAQEQLARALLDLNEAQDIIEQKDSEVATATRSAEQILSERTSKLSALESQSSQLQAAVSKAEADVTSLTAQLKEATDARDAAVANAEQAAKDVQSRDAELEQLNAMVVELKTEATIAKAELEGAYGSRTQRAKDVAALAKSAENEELQSQIDKMKKELASTLKEYEDLTKDTIAAEREKLDLEGQLDDALAAKASLEAESRATREKLEAAVASLKEELDAEKLKVAPGTSRAGASMLSEQFRATMKEERKKFQEELRNEQTQRRKLEDEIRTLKRAVGPGKSPLSPR